MNSDYQTTVQIISAIIDVLARVTFIFMSGVLIGIFFTLKK